MRGSKVDTLRNAALTSGVVIRSFLQRFSMRSLLDAPELRQAIVLIPCGTLVCRLGAGVRLRGVGKAASTRRKCRLKKASFNYLSSRVVLIPVTIRRSLQYYMKLREMSYSSTCSSCRASVV